MTQEMEFTLEFSEQTAAMVEELARRTGSTTEQVVESIIREYLMRQMPVIEKRAAETGTTVHELVNMQFERLVEFIHSRAQNQ